MGPVAELGHRTAEVEASREPLPWRLYRRSRPELREGRDRRRDRQCTVQGVAGLTRLEGLPALLRAYTWLLSVPARRKKQRAHDLVQGDTRLL